MSAERAGPEQLRRLLEAVMTVGTDLELPVVLRRITRTAVDLVGSDYGALGVLSPDGSYLSDFITVGIDDEAMRRMGGLPEGHGILGLLIADPRPLRLPDLSAHPDSFGLPPGHPEMSTFLGVPLYVGGETYGNLYLTDKSNGELFTDVDEELVVALARAAGLAIERSRLAERVRDVVVVEDRDRIARDLHDTVIQRLFATGLALQGAAHLASAQPELATRINQAVDELDVVVREVRTSIFELQSAGAGTESEGLRSRLLVLGDTMADALGYAPIFQFDGPIDTVVSDDVGTHVLAVVGEALTNIARHAASPSASVAVVVRDSAVVVTVRDAGVGLAAATPRADSRGLDNIAHRAEQLGGRLEVDDAPGGGTTLRWSVPL